MKNTWRNCPTIINKLPTDNKSMILFIDESGEGNKKVLHKAFSDKKIIVSTQLEMIFFC